MKKIRDDTNYEKLKGLISGLEAPDHHLIPHAKTQVPG